MVVFFLKMMKIPTQKGEHSCKCTGLSLKQEGISKLKGMTNIATLVKDCRLTHSVFIFLTRFVEVNKTRMYKAIKLKIQNVVCGWSGAL